MSFSLASLSHIFSRRWDFLFILSLASKALHSFQYTTSVASHYTCLTQQKNCRLFLSVCRLAYRRYPARGLNPGEAYTDRIQVNRKGLRRTSECIPQTHSLPFASSASCRLSLPSLSIQAPSMKPPKVRLIPQSQGKGTKALLQRNGARTSKAHALFSVCKLQEIRRRLNRTPAHP